MHGQALLQLAMEQQALLHQTTSWQRKINFFVAGKGKIIDPRLMGPGEDKQGPWFEVCIIDKQESTNLLSGCK